MAALHKPDRGRGSLDFRQGRGAVPPVPPVPPVYRRKDKGAATEKGEV